MTDPYESGFSLHTLPSILHVLLGLVEPDAVRFTDVMLVGLSAVVLEDAFGERVAIEQKLAAVADGVGGEEAGALVHGGDGADGFHDDGDDGKDGGVDVGDYGHGCDSGRNISIVVTECDCFLSWSR